MSRTRLNAALALVLVGSVLAIATLSGAGAAQVSDNTSNKSGYYDDSDTQIDNGTWFAGRENATLDNSITMLTRVQTYIIGTNTGSGLAAAGSLVAGLLVMGAVMSGAAGVRLGLTGGAVAGTSLVAGLVVAGLAPSWLWAVVLGVVGLLVGRGFLRLVR